MDDQEGATPQAQIPAPEIDSPSDCPDSTRDMATCPECDICPYSGFENG
ncbi:MAG: hypothetical protein HGA39_05925 [Coriobacteriia bacterium]|nr:hypothetical protein [Coriobacteriia bacterium]